MITVTRGDYVYKYNSQDESATITNEKTGVVAKLGKENAKECNSSNEILDQYIKILFVDNHF